MKRIPILALTLCLLSAAFTFAGKPHPVLHKHPEGPIKQKMHRVEDAIADSYAEQHRHMQTFAGHAYQGYGGASCPPHYYGGGSGYGANLGCYPRHLYTYGYKRPRHLVYPQPHATGGAVVYPYYTHKGPSDFFRQ